MARNTFIPDTFRTTDDKLVINPAANFIASDYGGIMTSLIGLDITQFPVFNQKNEAVMRFHMMRNDIQKVHGILGSGSNAYADGNPNNDSVPVPIYSYSIGHSYNGFSHDIHLDEGNGVLTTSRLTNNDGSNATNTNYYFDYNGVGSAHLDVMSLRSDVERLRTNGLANADNSLLYKTKRLFEANKIKTIISEFHTKGVRYNGQVGTDKYGESHGRNLLTKSAETNNGVKEYNGYDNPYCRVWTHHYTYDRLSKTMRSNPDARDDVNASINYWGNEFEWNERDGKKKENTNKYHEGEKYDYAWRGLHNQQRRKEHSVLNESTGLVNITPKYGGGGSGNIHTKSCMFSIENLAWKDYDPYSFEKALSWEQRGPLGGRIMWFPPYNLKITETNSAKWTSNEFIGRGEPVYTYTNSERSGMLSFTLLVDHPSSIDYASWHDKSNVHNDNDYLRYFAGCFNDENGMAKNGMVMAKKMIEDSGYEDVINNEDDVISVNGGDNLLEVPPFMADEYTQPVTPKKDVRPEKQPVGTNSGIPEENEPIRVEFYVFYPNNYSGYYDYPTKVKSDVDSLLYLLLGTGVQKEPNGSVKDRPLRHAGDVVYGPTGYEMTNMSISNENEYIIGYATDNEGKNVHWKYRIDCYVDGSKYGRNENDVKKSNTITQRLSSGINYADNCSYHLNSDTKNIEFSDTTTDKRNLYSLAEIAYVYYQKTEPAVVQKLDSMLGEGWKTLHKDNIDNITDIFDNHKLTGLNITGIANNHETNASEKIKKDRNEFLAEQRGETVRTWLYGYNDGWKDKNIKISNPSGVHAVDDKKNDVSSLSAKLNRHAHVVMEFTSNKVTSLKDANNDTNDIKSTDDGPYVGGEFNASDWVLVTDYNINQLLDIPSYECYNPADVNQQDKDFNVIYERSDDESATPNFPWTIVYAEDGEYHSYEQWANNPPFKNEVVFTGIYDKNHRYDAGDVVFWNNNFYWRKQSVGSNHSDDGGASGGNENEIKEYFGFRWIREENVGNQVWNYYEKLPKLTCFEEIGSDMVEYSMQQTEDDAGCRIWVDRGDGNLINECELEAMSKENSPEGRGRAQELNKLRYDQEYMFYQRYFDDHPFVLEKLREKIRYFNPAFHSMTPEGFNGRLTFLNQCTRQGDTLTRSDKYNNSTANNLAFGRPPFCVLRLGDFYNQLIVIESISYDFDTGSGLQWDLNPEGNGVQPMLCNVSISFKFIGGGDITGPVRRLQNAMSFNYYANTSFYDNRADRVEYNDTNWATMGGAGNNEINLAESYAYQSQTYDADRNS